MVERRSSIMKEQVRERIQTSLRGPQFRRREFREGWDGGGEASPSNRPLALSPLTWPLTFEAETRQRYMSEGEGGGSGKEENGEHGVKFDSTLFSSLS